eukprot:Hpha_TRINITY_DN16052_c1_g2::TRINITY_DN16052_c1_g2_i1::g.119360::m.119360
MQTLARVSPVALSAVVRQQANASAWSAFVGSRMRDANLKDLDVSERKIAFRETQTETGRLWKEMSAEDKAKWQTIADEMPAAPKRAKRAKRGAKAVGGGDVVVKEKKPRAVNPYFAFHKENFSRIYRELEPGCPNKKELFSATVKRVKELWDAQKEK